VSNFVRISQIAKLELVIGGILFTLLSPLMLMKCGKEHKKHTFAFVICVASLMSELVHRLLWKGRCITAFYSTVTAHACVSVVDEALRYKSRGRGFDS
jgi:uncharacterized membrane protein